MKIMIIEADAEELRANRRVSDVIWDALETYLGVNGSSDTEEESEADVHANRSDNRDSD